MKIIKIKPIKLHFRLDTDKDKVRDHKDCRPFNKHKQHWDVEKEKKKGATIEYMDPDEYIEKTGLKRRRSPSYYDDYFEKYYDTEKEEMRPISELAKIIKDPKKKVALPFIGAHSSEHEGRHRAYAGKLAGQKKIPVIVGSLRNVSLFDRERIAKDFLLVTGLDRDPAYAQEWIDRFRRGYPESYMDSRRKRIYFDILRNYNV